MDLPIMSVNPDIINFLTISVLLTSAVNFAIMRWLSKRSLNDQVRLNPRVTTSTKLVAAISCLNMLICILSMRSLGMMAFSAFSVLLVILISLRNFKSLKSLKNS